MKTPYVLEDVKTTATAVATQNACKLCTPLGAALVFKGIAGSIPLLHGSQGCSTYIRRYLISHFKEPMDIACSNFAEDTAIFGGGANLKLAITNIIQQYSPAMIGIATTCLAETIGDDVAMFIREFKAMNMGTAIPPLVHVSTPSYQGTHMQGFYGAVRAVMATLALTRETVNRTGINLFPGMLSPADIRHLKDVISAFGLTAMVLPDYSQTLDGGLWKRYERIPKGGTTVPDIAKAGNNAASIELGKVLGESPGTAGTDMEKRLDVCCRRLGLPIGIRQTDLFMTALGEISGKALPESIEQDRARLLDAMVDAHKHLNGVRAAVYGEADLVAGMVDFFAEIGIIPVICATGDRDGRFENVIRQTLPDRFQNEVTVMQNADFIDIEAAAAKELPDILIGHSKGYSLSRKLDIPLVRIGFPVHDRVGGSRLLHVGYQGTQQLFDRIANALIEKKQAASTVGYTYM